MSATARITIGASLGVFIAWAAWRKRTLSGSGALAAVVVAIATVAAGWSWGLILVAFFLSATAISEYRAAAKRARTDDVVAKGVARDAVQVLANGGVFAVAAIGMVVSPSILWQVVGAGALASSAADTWATEIGTLSAKSPRSIVSFKRVSPGTSGGVTVAGTFGALAGAVCIALVTFLVEWPVEAACAAVLGGFVGAITDSFLGATLQAKRWCTQCDRGTERAVHGCGTTTSVVAGFRWLDNDAVNALSSLAGALVGMLCLG